MSEESDSKNIKKKDVKEEYSENKNLSFGNLQMFMDEFNNICSSYFRSFADIQKECTEILENNIKTNRNFREKWFSGKFSNPDLLERYLQLLNDQLKDSTETLEKINEINNKVTSSSLGALNDYFNSYNKIFVANHNLCKKIAESWLTFYTKNSP